MKRLDSRRSQRGATLVVVLIMLVILTLFGISAINLSSSNLKVVGNMQARKQTEAVGLQEVETVMNSMIFFSSPLNKVTTSANGYDREISKRVCLYSAAASGYSAVQPIVPEDNQWDFRVTVTDTLTGAKARIWQGAKIRMLAGSCPTNALYD